MVRIIDADSFEKEKRAGIPDAVLERAGKIVEEVGKRGLDAVAEYSRTLDNFEATASSIRVGAQGIGEAAGRLGELEKKAIDEAFARVGGVQEEIAANALRESRSKVGDGYVLLRPRAMGRVGVYVPGGVAPLPSSLLMAGASARAAGVKEIIVCTPPRKEGISPAIAYAAKKLGVEEIFIMGGAQAIAAMACGLPGVMEKADMVCGPGNVYAAAAKQVVSAKGLARVDLVAGPSEVMIIADAGADARYIAADMIAQAEHGSNSPAVLLTDSRELAKKVDSELEKQLGELKNRANAEKSLREYGAIVLVEGMGQAVGIADRYAPEHLEILAKDSGKIAGKIENAGAIFVNTCESFADYGMSGGNHILPTGGTARFLSGLSAYDFIVRTYVEVMSDKEQEKLAGLAAAFADIEGLEGHARAARLRGGAK